MKFKTILWLWLAGLTIVLAFSFAGLSFGQGGEVEPNNTCNDAQDLGTTSLPVVVEGTLGSSAYPPPGESPDVDFFRFTTTPGELLVVDLEGLASYKGTLGNPYLGQFDSDCNLAGADDDGGEGANARMEFGAPDNGTVILGVTGCCDGDFSGAHDQGGTYRLTVREMAYAGSITGRVVDGDSGLPLPGDTDPYAGVYLFRCASDECYELVSSQATDGAGSFRFDRDVSGNPLFGGRYKLEAYANGYITGSSNVFEVTEGEHKDIGDIAIYPVDYIGSIRGVVVDENTGAPIPGYQLPYAYVELWRCYENDCFDYAATASISDVGEFSFEYPDYMLEPGDFQIVTSIAGYRPATSQVFAVGADEHVELGAISVTPLPIIGSIRGRIVDSVTSEPISGYEHWSYAELYRCYEGLCEEYLANSAVDEWGEFVLLGADYMIEAGEFQVIAHASGYYRKVSEIFTVGSGEEIDLGDLALEPIPLAGSISGRIVNSVTGDPLPGTEEPFAFVDLWRFNEWQYYEWISGQSADIRGNFHFEGDYMGNRLTIGSYRISVYATDYQYFEGEPFEVGEGEHYNLGDTELTPYPVQFSDIQSCGDLPTEGGNCSYSVTIANRSGRRLIGAAWSLIDVWGTGSFTGYTQFQVGRLEKFNLPAGSSERISFSIEVPGTLLDGSTVCSQIFVGEGRRNQYFNTIGQHFLFCVQKGVTGFSVLSDEETQKLVRETHQRNPALQSMGQRPQK